MKTLATTCICLLLTVLGLQQGKAQSPVLGAWQAQTDSVTTVMLITTDYFTVTSYTPHRFISTMGGTWVGTGDHSAATNIEFNSANKSQVGQHPDASADFEGENLVVNLDGQRYTFSRLDDGSAALAGCWQITARDRDGKMSPMQPGPRKTIKILTGTRFQWVAINTQTGEFFGTGGGTYTFENNVYTENIDFFSRDNSRVGASLEFKGTVNGDKWDHSGKSSKGDPIHEEWTRK
jgi:hypothetical protein